MIDDKLKPFLIEPLNVINNAQQRLWELHHAVKQHDEKLAMEIWEQTLQIENALLKINENVLGGDSYL